MLGLDRAWATGGYGGYLYMCSHADAVSKRETLNSLKQKRLSHRSPALEFVHLLREKKCYSLYATAEQVDHFLLSQLDFT